MNKLGPFQKEGKARDQIEAEQSLNGYLLEGQKMPKMATAENTNAIGAKKFEYKMKKMEKWPAEPEAKRNQWDCFLNFNSDSPALPKDKAAVRPELKGSDFVIPQ